MERDFQLPGRSGVYASAAAAATSHPAATETAIRVLRAGGNAVDAAVAAAAVLGVCEPHNTGIGGDCFALVAEPDGRVYGINGSGRSPEALTLDSVADAGFDRLDPFSPHAVTVPGAVDAWARLLERSGRWALDQVLAPAIDLAQRGCPVAPRVAWDWTKHVARLARDDGSRQHLLRGGEAPGTGDLFRAPALAKALRAIAERGPAGFYEGEVAEDIVATVAAARGAMGLNDLKRHAGFFVEPMKTDYRGITVAELPPNGQGVTALLLLNMLETFDLQKLDPLGAARLHIEMEACRIAYAIRDKTVADPQHVGQALKELLTKEAARELASRIEPGRRFPEDAAVAIGGADTIYLTVVDEERRAVSFINSLYMAFGSGITTPRFGITLQNRGACFVLKPGHPNCLGPAKRPLHTIIPAMALVDGKPILSFGVMGGAYQACGHARLISNIVDYGMTVQSAIDAPRAFWHDSGALHLERGFSARMAEDLEAWGYRVGWADAPWGGAQAIRVHAERKVLEAGSDPRKDGIALGY